MAERSRGYGAAFRYDGLTIGVRTSRLADLRWLKEFLSPQFRVLERARTDATVSLHIDAGAWQAMRDRGPHVRGKRADVYLLDTAVARFPVWQGPGRQTTVYDESFDVFHTVRRRPTHVTILARTRGGSSRLALMRVVRELAMNHTHRRGRLVVHGAGIRVGHTGVILAGHKRSGKTSLLVHSLGADGADYLSNDRVVVDLESSRPRLLGMPTIVSVRRSSLRLFPDLRTRLTASGFYPALTVGEAGRAPLGRARPWRNRAFTLSPRQLCDLLGATSRADAPLGAIVIPVITDERGGIVLERLSPTRAALAIRRTLFRARFARKSGGLLVPGGRERHLSERTLRAQCRRLSECVPCVVARLGRQAYREGGWTSDLPLHGS